MRLANDWCRQEKQHLLQLSLIHSPCRSIVRASHWSSEDYRLYTYAVTFAYQLSSPIEHLTDHHKEVVR